MYAGYYPSACCLSDCSIDPLASLCIMCSVDTSSVSLSRGTPTPDYVLQGCLAAFLLAFSMVLRMYAARLEGLGSRER